jgi:hypothetical protein
MWSIPSPEDPVATRAAGEGPALGTAKAAALRQGAPDAQGLSDSPQYAVERVKPHEENVLERSAGTNWIESPERGNGRRDKRHLFIGDASRTQGRDTDHKCQGCYIESAGSGRRGHCLRRFGAGTERRFLQHTRADQKTLSGPGRECGPGPLNACVAPRIGAVPVFRAAGNSDEPSWREARPRPEKRSDWRSWT